MWEEKLPWKIIQVLNLEFYGLQFESLWTLNCFFFGQNYQLKFNWPEHLLNVKKVDYKNVVTDFVKKLIWLFWN